ncbi:4Fe-4S binding protein [Candidatus Calescamantes bacterium]|nr:4Fe-4S binding protein [Candidatus Calescamantes bacterium]
MLRVDVSLCLGCGACERVCPTGAIKVIMGKASINTSLCRECLLCAKICPRSAIKKIKPSYSLKDIHTQIQKIEKELALLRKKLNRIAKSKI